MSWLSNFLKPSYYEATKSGKIFGWWINLDGHRIANLDYRAFDVDSQFWSTYMLDIVSERFSEVGFDPDKWSEKAVTIQSRFATQFTQRGVLMSNRGNNLIALRSLSVPKDEFQIGVKSAEELTMKWSKQT